MEVTYTHTWNNFLISCILCVVLVIILLSLSSLLKTVSEPNVELEAVSVNAYVLVLVWWGYMTACLVSA